MPAAPSSTARAAFDAALRRYRSVLAAQPIDATALLMCAHDCGRRARSAGIALGAMVEMLADFRGADLPWQSRLPVDTTRAAAMAYCADEPAPPTRDTSGVRREATDEERRPS